MRLERPSFTLEFEPGSFQPTSGATYLVGQDIHEERGQSIPFTDESVSVVSVTRPDRDQVELLAADQHPLGGADLYDAEALRHLLKQLTVPIYIDITSMEHQTWAPLVKAATTSKIDFKAVYIQPLNYTKSNISLPGLFWDLSDEIEGIAPLPGFISLRRDPSKTVKFVPLMGFEGNRLDHLLTTEEFDPEDIVPVVGSPGFRIEYPVETILANRNALQSGFVFNQREYAKANCPFDLYFLLEHVRERNPNCLLLVAPIGTKPHALGAILQAIAHPTHTELLYDHPVRKSSRSSGDGLICLYDVGAFALEVIGVE